MLRISILSFTDKWRKKKCIDEKVRRNDAQFVLFHGAKTNHTQT